MKQSSPILKVSPVDPSHQAMRFAADMLRSGGLVVFPTETVYGIAANCLSAEALAKLYSIKKNRKGKPFTVHIADRRSIKAMKCNLTEEAKALINKFWPGPLTIVLKSQNGDTVGFRMPRNRIALELIRLSRVPVVAPSANLSDTKPPVSAGEALKNVGGRVDLILDGGCTELGTESTVVDMSTDKIRILRRGAISDEAIFKTAGEEYKHAR